MVVSGQGNFGCRGSSADGGARLVDLDLDACASQRNGRAEAIGTAAEDGRFFHPKIKSESTIELPPRKHCFAPLSAACVE